MKDLNVKVGQVWEWRIRGRTCQIQIKEINQRTQYCDVLCVVLKTNFTSIVTGQEIQTDSHSMTCKDYQLIDTGLGFKCKLCGKALPLVETMNNNLFCWACEVS